MNEMKRTDYEKELWAGQKLPKEKRYVLVQIAERPGAMVTKMYPRPVPATMSPTVAVGYLKYAAGDKNSPQFIVPGVGGPVVAWCDCLGDDFHAPLWAGKQSK